MYKLLIIGSGGFIGAILRYLVSGLVLRLSGNAVFPYGTLTVNMIGCFLIGFGGGLIETRQFFTPEARSFIFIGLLGSFTTFSTFGLETFNLARDIRILSALFNIGMHLVIGFAAVWTGHALSRFM